MITTLDAGDIESMPFIEALGQFSYRVGKNIQIHVHSFLLSVSNYSIKYNMLFMTGAGNFCLVHVSLVPVLNVVGEQV